MILSECRLQRSFFSFQITHPATLPLDLDDKELNFTMFEDTGLIGIVKCKLGATLEPGIWNLTSLLVGIWHNSDTSLEVWSSLFQPTLFRDLMSQCPSLHLVVFAFGNSETMECITRKHPELSSPPRSHQYYYFASRGPAQQLRVSDEEEEKVSHPGLVEDEFEESVEDLEDYSDPDAQVWSIIDPVTMKPTGTYLTHAASTRTKVTMIDKR